MPLFGKDKPAVYTPVEWDQLWKDYISDPIKFEERTDVHWLAKEILAPNTFTVADYLRERKAWIKGPKKETVQERQKRMRIIAQKRDDELYHKKSIEIARKEQFEERLANLEFKRPANRKEDFRNDTRSFYHKYGIPPTNLKVAWVDDVAIDENFMCWKLPPDDLHPWELRTDELYLLLVDPHYQADVFAKHIRNPYFRVFFWDTIRDRVHEFTRNEVEQEELLELHTVWPLGVDIRNPSLDRVADPPIEELERWGWFEERKMVRFEEETARIPAML
ncbi:hypothetical protein BT69DRAFT_1319324 [Atractiella rhizophila]|nr:hypothetical protein BT69DRAFT_1319324 [Atractiella rhizophila]